MSSASFYIIRHAETIWNAQRRLQGRIDIELSETGIEQCLARRPDALKIEPDVICCSPLIRAKRSAELLFDVPETDFVIEPLFTERSFGRYEGWINSDVGPGILHRTNPLFDGEESYEVAERFRRGLEKQAELHPGQKIAVVSHGASILLFFRSISDRYGDYRLYPIANCSIHLVKYDAGRFSEPEEIL